VIGPNKAIKLLLVYPMTIGRNFNEVLRVTDALQLTAAHEVVTPANWKPGQARDTCTNSRIQNWLSRINKFRFKRV
jgi:alkyl hydroperoxide reductase subunit AhpC